MRYLPNQHDVRLFSGRLASSSELIDNEVLGVFKCGDRSVAGDAWEIVEEFIKRFAAFEVIQKILERHTSTPKHRRSPEDLGISNYDGIQASQSHARANS